MAEEVEISSLDLRYESYRLKSPRTEKALLASILEQGIRDPLQGAGKNGLRILLNGFKRLRCAKKLGIEIVPYSSLGNDEPLAIIELLRIANAKSLSILEQAKLIDELKTVHHMSTSEIADLLERSKAWVSMRAGIICEMSECVADKIFKGEFPVYAYMYTLRQFIRMNRVKKEEIDEFVRSVAGKNLSIRDIEMLAHGYFKGPEELRQQIQNGNISWGLRRMKETSLDGNNCTEIERSMLRELEITQKYMQRITYKSRETKFKNNDFYVQANLLAGGIIRLIDVFSKAIKEFYDRTRKA